MIVMWLVFDRALLEKPEGYYTGVLNNYGDLPFHLSVITRFAFGQNYPPEDPTFAGVRFTYPFLTDFVSAMFVRLGATLRNRCSSRIGSSAWRWSACCIDLVCNWCAIARRRF